MEKGRELGIIRAVYVGHEPRGGWFVNYSIELLNSSVVIPVSLDSIGNSFEADARLPARLSDLVGAAVVVSWQRKELGDPTVPQEIITIRYGMTPCRD